MILALIAVLAAAAPPARIELHPIKSSTPTDQEFLTGTAAGPDVTVAGELRLPTRGPEKVPAMVLVHGSGGIGSNVGRWADELNALGVASFVLDGFTPRGITETVNDQSQLGRFPMLVDAYHALALLQRHPRIDATRIGLMGFSRGGLVTLYAGLRRFQKLSGVGAPSFAVYVAMYPGCQVKFLEDTARSPGPLLILGGSADDYTPVSYCRAYVERLQGAGNDVRLVEFPGATHCFDCDAFPKPHKLDGAVTLGACRLEETQPGVVTNLDTGNRFSRADACAGRSPTIAYDADAYARALGEVQQLLRSAFHLAH